MGKILIAALSRADVPREERTPFHLIVDEYQSFATSSFPAFQAEARKFNIDTLVAHQYRAQLDADNRGSTLNVGNKLIFRINGLDASELAKDFDNTPPPPDKTMQPLYRPHGTLGDREPLYMRYDSPEGVGSLFREVELPRRPYSDVEAERANKLTTLAQYRAQCKMVSERGELVERVIETNEPVKIDPGAQGRAAEMRRRSREQYGRARREVEQTIENRLRLDEQVNKLKEYE